jgi:hypothetical protein
LQRHADTQVCKQAGLHPLQPGETGRQEANALRRRTTRSWSRGCFQRPRHSPCTQGGCVGWRTRKGRGGRGKIGQHGTAQQAAAPFPELAHLKRSALREWRQPTRNPEAHRSLLSPNTTCTSCRARSAPAPPAASAPLTSTWAAAPWAAGSAEGCQIDRDTHTHRRTDGQTDGWTERQATRQADDRWQMKTTAAPTTTQQVECITRGRPLDTPL